MTYNPMPKGDWLTNIPWKSHLRAWNGERAEAGPPSATPRFSQEQLREMGYLGLYAHPRGSVKARAEEEPRWPT